MATKRQQWQGDSFAAVAQRQIQLPRQHRDSGGRRAGCRGIVEIVAAGDLLDPAAGCSVGYGKDWCCSCGRKQQLDRAVVAAVVAVELFGCHGDESRPAIIS